MDILRDLVEACKVGDLAKTRELVSTDSTLAIQSNHEGICALHVACLHGHVDIVHYLLDKGASVHMRTTDGSTALTEAMYGGWANLIELLLQHGAMLNPPLQLSTPLHEAALAGQLQCCKLLIYYGASLIASDCNYGIPLLAACYNGNTDTVRLLLDCGSNVNATKTHSTCLHVVADKHPENHVLLHMLLAYGGNPWALDNHSRLPIDILMNKTGSETGVKILRDWMEQPHSLMITSRLTVMKVLMQPYKTTTDVNHTIVEQLPISTVMKSYLKGNMLLDS